VNALARRDVSIVSALPGTTRDAVEATLELGGVPVTLVDTAGLRDTDDPVEAEGVRRARSRAAAADIVVHVVDAAADTAFGAGLGIDTDGSHAGCAESCGGDALGAPSPKRIVVYNKIDLVQAPVGALGISLETGAGVDGFVAALTDVVRRLALPEGGATLTRTRHLLALRDAVLALRAAEAVKLPELRGEELRRAMLALGRITGAVNVEAILDTVFGSFCIGK
jgi:tRNA modification GTPase